MAKSKKFKGPAINYGRKPTRLDVVMQSICMALNNTLALIIRN
jgi:hypothetical protein